MLVCNNLLI